MNRSYLLPVTIAAIFVAGCAATEPKSAEPQSEPRYITGSRLPARDATTSTDVKSISNRNDINNMGRGDAASAPKMPGP